MVGVEVNHSGEGARSASGSASGANASGVFAGAGLSDLDGSSKGVLYAADNRDRIRLVSVGSRMLNSKEYSIRQQEKPRSGVVLCARSKD